MASSSSSSSSSPSTADTARLLVINMLCVVLRSHTGERVVLTRRTREERCDGDDDDGRGMEFNVDMEGDGWDG